MRADGVEPRERAGPDSRKPRGLGEYRGEVPQRVIFPCELEGHAGGERRSGCGCWRAGTLVCAVERVREEGSAVTGADWQRSLAALGRCRVGADYSQDHTASCSLAYWWGS